ncbi:MAG: putative ABC exporter domain-containing protein [Algoriphagus sp.]|nr:putative ABC exporter domain-containing protein [Algoriphagus sp.]
MGNNLLLILRNPLRLIPYGLALAYFLFMYSRGISGSEGASAEVDLDAVGEVDVAVQNIIGVLTVLALAYFLFQLYRASQKNITFFKMADVNLLFPAPVKPANILLYYMGRSFLPALGGSLFFLVYSGGQLARDFDLDFLGAVFLVMGFTFYFFLIFPLRFLIYTLNTRFQIIEGLRLVIFLVGLGMALVVIIPGLMAEKFWEGMFAWVASPWFDLVPIVGWSKGMMSYFFTGNWILSTCFLMLYVLTYFTIVKLVIRFSGYYYEDVLDATQSNEDRLEKAKGKKEVTEDTYSLNTKKQLALPEFGLGAKAIYWRNYVQSSRQDFHPLFGVYSMGMAVLGIVFAGLSHFEWFAHQIFYIYLIFLLFFYFMAGFGRANIGDLKKPWFILIPASWSSKFWNMIKLDLLQTLLFSLVLIVPSVFLAQFHWGLILFFPLGMIFSYLIGLGLNLIPQIGLDEGWDRILIKPLMIGGISIFGLLPSLFFAVLFFAITKQFVYGLAVGVLGLGAVAGLLLHVSLDILKRLEFKEM